MRNSRVPPRITHRFRRHCLRCCWSVERACGDLEVRGAEFHRLSHVSFCFVVVLTATPSSPNFLSMLRFVCVLYSLPTRQLITHFSTYSATIARRPPTNQQLSCGPRTPNSVPSPQQSSKTFNNKWLHRHSTSVTTVYGGKSTQTWPSTT